jgi:hypothetical protein
MSNIVKVHTAGTAGNNILSDMHVDQYNVR